MQKNPFIWQITTTKQELEHYINPSGRGNYTNIRNPQWGRGGFHRRPYTRGTQNTRVDSHKPTKIHKSNVASAADNSVQTIHNRAQQNLLKMCQTHHVNASCRSTKVNCLKDWNDEKQKVETETDILDNDPVAFAEFTSKDGWEEWQVDKFSFVAISEEFKVEKLSQLVGRWPQQTHRKIEN